MKEAAGPGRTAGLVAMEDCIIRTLQWCRRKRKGPKIAKRLHGHARNLGLEAHRDVGGYIVQTLVVCGCLASAHHVFNKMIHRSSRSWASLVSGYAKQGRLEEAFTLYGSMRARPGYPSIATHLALLKACAAAGDAARGAALHADIARLGHGHHARVCNSLIHMYARCGWLAEARTVFDGVPERGVVPWSALIGGYVGCRRIGEALECLGEMEQAGVQPNAFTYVCALKACGIAGAVEQGLSLHAGISRQGLESNVYVGSALVDMYAKWGSLLEARRVFEGLPARNAVTWTALIAGYAEHGPAREALVLFERMRSEGVAPSAVTFPCVIRACGGMRSADEGRRIHRLAAKRGLCVRVSVGNSLVDMYAKCGSLSEARAVFDALPVRNVVAWSALIAGYAEHGHGRDALACLGAMKLDGILPNAITLVSVVKACVSAGRPDMGVGVHAEVVRGGLEGDRFIGNALVSMYAKCDSLAEAEEVFGRLPSRDAVSWTALIAGYAKHGRAREALLCFERMQVEEGVLPTVVTLVCVVGACGSTGAIEKGREIRLRLTKQQLASETILGNAFIDMFGKCGSLLEAHEVFRNLSDKSIVSWNSLIGGYTEHDRGQEALELYEEMRSGGVPPDVITFVHVIKACGKIGAVDRGREIHIEAVRSELEGDPSVCNVLVDMYAKCGSVCEAREIFDAMPVKTVVSWSAMIIGYGVNHEGFLAIRCFEDMLRQGVEPDPIAFTCLLTACSRASLVPKGRQYFKVMQEEFGIVPMMDHYTCIVHLLARSGRLREAEEFLDSVPYPLSTEMWTALLSDCQTYGEAELGLRCFDRLVKMRPDNAAAYVLMANAYTNSGSKKHSFLIEDLRKHSGARKKPASALIEVNKKVHEFMVGDTRSKEVSAMLDVLSSRMEEGGYMPNLDQVLKPVSDGERDAALCEHAEKLALAFGLLSTPPGQVLRVSKNMRMCSDCHLAATIVSGIERREIIVRDSYCVHRFKDSLCSCKLTLESGPMCG